MNEFEKKSVLFKALEKWNNCVSVLVSFCTKRGVTTFNTIISPTV